MKKIIYSCIILGLLSGCSSKESTEETTLKEEIKVLPVEPTLISSPLTGNEVLDKNGQHFSVMIENSTDARPQSGLGDADIVYEIKTEGNISRYLAFFHDKIPEVVGPVRSSRHYFIPLAEGMNFPYIHFGASTYAYEYLKSNELEIPHVDGIYDGKYFFRDSNRVAPHNAYLKTNTLDSYKDLIITNESFSFGERKDTSMNTAISVDFSYNNFTDIKYAYDDQSNTYLRFQENEPNIDNNSGKQIAVKNVIIQYVRHENIQDDKKGRIEVSMTGSGNITLFSEGKSMNGTWKKGITDKSVTYYDEGGNILELNKGNTWIQVLEKDAIVKVN